MPKANTNKSESFEATLWLAADKLRKIQSAQPASAQDAAVSR